MAGSFLFLFDFSMKMRQNKDVKVDIEKLALLARIELNPREKSELQKEFDGILGYISKLKEVDTNGIGDKENGKTAELENVMREDKNPYKAGEFSEYLLRQAPEVEKDYVKVKHILEQ